MEGGNANLDLTSNANTAMDNQTEESDLRQQYLRLRQRAIGVACAAITTLIHLHLAAVTLHKSKVDPKIARLRGKTINNWDKMQLLVSTSRTTGVHATTIGQSSRGLSRAINFEAMGNTSGGTSGNDQISGSCKQRQHNPTFDDSDPISSGYSWSQKTGGSNLSGKKRKAINDMQAEELYQDFTYSIRELSSALRSYGVAIGDSRVEDNRNAMIMEMLQAMNLSEDYLVRSYLYLCQNSGKAANFIGSTPSLRGRVLDCIMRRVGLDD